MCPWQVILIICLLAGLFGIVSVIGALIILHDRLHLPVTWVDFMLVLYITLVVFAIFWA